jgi:hypothetical protein
MGNNVMLPVRGAVAELGGDDVRISIGVPPISLPTLLRCRSRQEWAMTGPKMGACLS